MKIIFLNAWCGQVHDELAAYLKAHAPTTDIFCFQEADNDMQALCAGILSDYAVYTDSKVTPDDDEFYQATYVRNGIPVASSGTVLKDQPKTGFGLYVEVGSKNGNLFICNYHGAFRPGDKLDDANRPLASKTLIDFFKDKERVVIGGDFNLLPETESVRMFKKDGYRDLIQEFDIKTTRNHFAWDKYPDNKQYYADYTFLSPSVSVQTFAVPDNSISDHLPLELEIDS